LYSFLIQNPHDCQSLTNLATILRRDNQRDQIDQSIALCKKALKSDFQFSNAWYGLGMSHLMIYFGISRKRSDLTMALAAFQRSDPTKNPDVYFNRAIVNQYRENYLDAIKDYQAAFESDNNSNFQTTALNLQEFVDCINNLIKNVKLFNVAQDPGTEFPSCSEQLYGRAGYHQSAQYWRKSKQICHRTSLGAGHKTRPNSMDIFGF
jgi:tetratricopeptide (TPR) repeat protein